MFMFQNDNIQWILKELYKANGQKKMIFQLRMNLYAAFVAKKYFSSRSAVRILMCSGQKDDFFKALPSMLYH